MKSLLIINFNPMFIFVKRGSQFDVKHVIISNAIHAIGGFGLAILLQQYLVGSPFVSVWVGWILVVCAMLAHPYLLSVIKHAR